MIGDVLQPTHLIFILVIALIVLGPKRLPEVGRSLGKGIRDFRGALSGNDEPEHSEPEPPAPMAAAPITPATTALPEEEPAVHMVDPEDVEPSPSSAPAPSTSVVPASGSELEAREEASEPEPHPVAPVADSTQRH